MQRQFSISKAQNPVIYENCTTNFKMIQKKKKFLVLPFQSDVQRKKPAEEILDDGQIKYHRINTTDDGRNSVLTVSYASTDTTYCCRFTNFKGSSEKCFKVIIHGLGTGIIAALAVAAFFVVAIILLALFLKRYYKPKVVLHIKMINSRIA
jgi:hypothetical protein